MENAYYLCTVFLGPILPDILFSKISRPVEIRTIPQAVYKISFIHGPRGRRPRPDRLTSLCAARRRPALPWRALLFPLRVTDREPGACGVAGTAEPPGRRRSVASRAQLPSPWGGGPHGSELDGSAPATPGLFGFLAVATRGPESAARVYGRPLSSDPSSGELRAPGRPWATAAAKAEW